MGIQPEEGSQYNVAPFIKNFIDTYVLKLHPEIKVFLKDQVYMNFDWVNKYFNLNTIIRLVFPTANGPTSSCSRCIAKCGTCWPR